MAGSSTEIRPGSQAQPTVWVVLLNFRSAEATLQCLASLNAQQYANWRAIVVENGSGDDSLERLQPVVQANDRLTLYASPENLGFSGGCNLALERALAEGADYVWLLNNDAWVQPDTLSQLVTMAEGRRQQGSVGVLGSLVLHPDGALQMVGRVHNPWLGKARRVRLPAVPNASGYWPVPCLSGASMLIPRHILETVGGLYEPFFLYYEDDEFCHRVRQAGFETGVCLNASVYHGLSKSAPNQALPAYYMQRNRLYFVEMTAGTLPLWSCLLLAVLNLGVLALKVPAAMLLKPSRVAACRERFWARFWGVVDYLQGQLGPCRHSWLTKPRSDVLV